MATAKRYSKSRSSSKERIPKDIQDLERERRYKQRQERHSQNRDLYEIDLSANKPILVPDETETEARKRRSSGKRKQGLTTEEQAKQRVQRAKAEVSAAKRREIKARGLQAETLEKVNQQLKDLLDPRDLQGTEGDEELHHPAIPVIDEGPNNPLIPVDFAREIADIYNLEVGNAGVRLGLNDPEELNEVPELNLIRPDPDHQPLIQPQLDFVPNQEVAPEEGAPQEEINQGDQQGEEGQGNQEANPPPPPPPPPQQPQLGQGPGPPQPLNMDHWFVEEEAIPVAQHESSLKIKFEVGGDPQGFCLQLQDYYNKEGFHRRPDEIPEPEAIAPLDANANDAARQAHATNVANREQAIARMKANREAANEAIEKLRLYAFHTKVSSAVRHWAETLSEEERTKWEPLKKAFIAKYMGVKGSFSASNKFESACIADTESYATYLERLRTYAEHMGQPEDNWLLVRKLITGCPDAVRVNLATIDIENITAKELAKILDRIKEMNEIKPCSTNMIFGSPEPNVNAIADIRRAYDRGLISDMVYYDKLQTVRNAQNARSVNAVQTHTECNWCGGNNHSTKDCYSLKNMKANMEKASRMAEQMENLQSLTRDLRDMQFQMNNRRDRSQSRGRYGNNQGYSNDRYNNNQNYQQQNRGRSRERSQNYGPSNNQQGFRPRSNSGNGGFNRGRSWDRNRDNRGQQQQRQQSRSQERPRSPWRNDQQYGNNQQYNNNQGYNQQNRGRTPDRRVNYDQRPRTPSGNRQQNQQRSNSGNRSQYGSDNRPMGTPLPTRQ